MSDARYSSELLDVLEENGFELVYPELHPSGPIEILDEGWLVGALVPPHTVGYVRDFLAERRRAVARWNAEHRPGDVMLIPGMNARVELVSEAWGGFADLPTVRVRFRCGNDLTIETSRLAPLP